MSRAYGARHLANKTFQPQMTNHFEVQIEGLGEDITLAVTKTSLPQISMSVVELHHVNSSAKMGGKVEYGDGSLEVIDAIRKDIEKIINDWQKQVYDPETDLMGWAEDYKKDALLTQYGPDGSYERTWKLEGVWPSSVEYGDLAYEGSDKKTISATLTYDRAYLLR